MNHPTLKESTGKNYGEIKILRFLCTWKTFSVDFISQLYLFIKQHNAGFSASEYKSNNL